MTNVQLSEAEIAAISGLLKSARESRGDNLAEAAFKIALSPSQLRAIEAGDLRPFYSTGYYLQAVERYAAYLGVAVPAREPPAAEVSEAIAQEAPKSEAATADAAAPDTAVADAPPAAEVSSTAATTLAPESKTSIAPIVVKSPDAITASPAAPSPVRREVAAEIDPPSERESKTFPWGWVAFAIAGLITIGVLKESLEPAAVPAPTANESAASSAALSENKPADSAATPSSATPAPSTSASAASTGTPAAPTTMAPQGPAGPAPKAATQAPLTAAGTGTAASLAVTTSAAASDGVLEMQVSTWVQIVKNNGEKTNIKVEPGQRVEFPSGSTAAVVFGQPEKARLTIKGKPVNLSPFITQESPPRGLVIISQIRD
ncbi:MAG: RodZ domain-containing protein [Betaproteobacteria bacterium]